ncbi:hypothetical protein [Streptomyces montanus]|nr:hypothetical protein [Streptomyces montanus]
MTRDHRGPTDPQALDVQAADLPALPSLPTPPGPVQGSDTRG